MFGQVIRDSFILILCGAAMIYGWVNRTEIYQFVGLKVVPLEQVEPAQAPRLAIAQTQPGRAGVTSIQKSPDGHFWSAGLVNKSYVKFLVDTGATTIALTGKDAKRAGFDLSALDYNSEVMTANGKTMAARVQLDMVAIGGVRMENVEALIVPDGLSTSLLGMSFLGRLRKVEVNRDAMVLRR
ncbi:MAG: TIGR02281 family clan AA aspartic protease [Robiginitomaculum sp.]